MTRGQNMAVSQDGALTTGAVNRAPYRKWTREENDRIASLYQKGASTKWIAMVFGVSRGSIQSKLSMWGLEPQKPCKMWTPEEQRTLAAMRGAGMSFNQIGAHLGRSKSSVRLQFKRMGQA